MVIYKSNSTFLNTDYLIEEKGIYELNNVIYEINNVICAINNVIYK